MFRLSISATAQRRLLPLPSQGAPAPGPIRPHGRGRRPAAAALLAACAMAAAAQPAPSTTPTRPAPPALRIVTLQPSLTETVCMLGGCDRLVGIDRYSDWPAAALQHLPRVGGLADANVEAIAALRPDLVLLNPRSRAAERLRALGLRVLPLEARTHADIRRNLETVALALGRPGAGEALWQTLNARLDATRARIPPEWLHRRVYLEMHGGQAAGESSFIGETLARLGLRSIAPAQMGAFPRLTPEYVLRANPDLLVTSQASPVPPPAKRPGWHALPAVRLQRHCHLAAHQFSVLLRPGPRLDEAAERVLACLHTVPAPAPQPAALGPTPARANEARLPAPGE